MIAEQNDRRVHLAAHPVLWALTRLVRRMGDVIGVPGLGLVISDAAAAHDVLQRDRDFTKAGRGGFAAVMTQVLGPTALGNMDGAAHRALRTRLRDVLAPERVCALLEAGQGPLLKLREGLAAGEAVDLVHFMRVLSGRLTLDMMGLPADEITDRAALDISALGDRLASSLRLRPLAGRRLAAARAHAARLADYARPGFASDRAPETSLVRRLRELGLTFDEAAGVLSFFFLAGTMTTGLALPRLAALLIDSGQMTMLRERPACIGPAIDEGLRFVAPLPVTTRIAQIETTVAGRRVRPGTRLVILTCNLARDPRLFPDPDRFDITRTPDSGARYLWYGGGAHFCLGFPLAQRQLHAVLEALASAGDLRVVERRPARGVLLPAYARLVVRSDGIRMTA